MQKIRTFLWFNDNAEEAVKFYLSIFKNSKILETIPGPGGKPLGLSFKLEGQEFMALNGGPQYSFTPAISLFVNCETQKEVDELWEQLQADGGKENACGWLQDKYGLSWQVIPITLGKLMQDKNRKKAQAVMDAMMKMKKIVIKDLKKAYEQAA